MKHPKSFNRVQRVGAILLLTSSLVLSGCADPVEQPSEQDDSVSGVEVPAETPPEANTPPVPGAPTDMPADATELPTTVEAAVLQAAAQDHSVGADGLDVVSAEAKSWPDGCLGLGGPDEICTFAIVDGWEVTVAQGDNRWVYRTDAEGIAVRQAEGAES